MMLARQPSSTDNWADCRWTSTPFKKSGSQKQDLWGRLYPVLAGQAIRRGLRTRHGICSQKQIIGVHNLTSRRNRANPVSLNPNILRTSQYDQCLCTNFGIHSRSKRYVLWRPQCCHKENSWQRITVHRRWFQRQSRCWSQLLQSSLDSTKVQTSWTVGGFGVWFL